MKVFFDPNSAPGFVQNLDFTAGPTLSGKPKEVVSTEPQPTARLRPDLRVARSVRSALELRLPDSRNNVMNGFRVSDRVLL